MIRVLLELWPVLLPLLAYVLWHLRKRRKARKAGEPLPRLREGPWVWAVLAAIGVGVVLLLGWGFSLEPQPMSRGYTPPHWEDGKMIPGSVEP